jgi:sn-glycerol 3-phosphate transport system permease protein
MERLRTAVTPWLLLLPAMVLLVAFTHWPAVATVWESFSTTAKKGRPSRFAGLDNYREMFGDEVFWQALWNNVLYAIGTVPLSIALAIAMALWVNSRLAGRGFLRLAYFTPTVLPMIAVANIWLFFYTPQYGLLEQITHALDLPSHNWLGDKSTVLGAIILVAIWKEAGFFMIFYLAALQQVSPALAEAAALEGASRWQYFRRVLFPLLMPTTLFVLINALINSVRMVDHLFVMTRGGPDNASMLLLYYIYQVGFSFWDTSYAAALTVVVLAGLGALAVFQLRVLERRTHYR